MTKTPDADDLRRRGRHCSLGSDLPEKQVAQQAMAAVCIAGLQSPCRNFPAAGETHCGFRITGHARRAAGTFVWCRRWRRAHAVNRLHAANHPGRIDPHDLLQELHMKATASKSDGMNRCLHVRE